MRERNDIKYKIKITRIKQTEFKKLPKLKTTTQPQHIPAHKKAGKENPSRPLITNLITNL